MNIDVDKIVVSLDVVAPDAVVVEASAMLPTQVVVISDRETPTVTPLEIIDFGISSIECAFDVTTEQAEEVVRGVLCGTTNPPTFENADYRLLHGQGSMDLVFAGLLNNTEYFLCPYALSNLGYKYGDVVAQMTKPSPIPNEYQLVEWLRSTGGQWIDTGVPISNNIRFEIDVIYNDLYSYKNGFGDYNVNSAMCYLRVLNGSIAFRFGSLSLQDLTTLAVNQRAIIKYDGYKFYVNNSQQNVTQQTFTTNYTLKLFQALTQGNYIQYPTDITYYSTKIQIEDEIVRDFYPVYRKADNKPGMYDIVNNQFYTNQGSGEFAVGQDKEWEEE